MSVKPEDNPSLVNCASHGTAKSIAEDGNIDLIKFKIDSLGLVEWIEENDAAFLQLNFGFSGNHSSGVSNFTNLDWGHGSAGPYSNTVSILNSANSVHSAYHQPGEYTISIDKPFKSTTNGPLSFSIDYVFGGLSYSTPWSSPPVINWSAFRILGRPTPNTDAFGFTESTGFEIGGQIDLTSSRITGEFYSKMKGLLDKIKVKDGEYSMSGKWPRGLYAKNILISFNNFTGRPPEILKYPGGPGGSDLGQVNYQITGNGFRGELPEFRDIHTIKTVNANQLHDDNPTGKFFNGKGKTMITYTIRSLASATGLKHLKFGAGPYYRQFRNKITVNGVPIFSGSKKIKLITLSHCGLSEEEASNFLIGLNNVNNYGGNIDIQGNNGLNAAGIAAKDALVSRGWTVTT